MAPSIRYNPDRLRAAGDRFSSAAGSTAQSHSALGTAPGGGVFPNQKAAAGYADALRAALQAVDQVGQTLQGFASAMNLTAAAIEHADGNAAAALNSIAASVPPGGPAH